MDPAISTPPLSRHSIIEIDTFCTACNYNLHGQVVTVDQRLGFPVCQCPECGKFHPAGTGVTASTLWVRRFASILLFTWIAIVLGTVLGILGGFFGLSSFSVEAFAYEKVFPASVNQYRFQMQLHDWRVPMTPDTTGFATMVYISIGSLVLGFVAGVLCVTLLWHWQRARYLYVIFMPLLSSVFLMAVYRSMQNYDLIWHQALQHVLSQAGFQSVGIFVGVLLGRKISRGIVKTIIPPKPRQFLTFLWQADGKTL